MHPRLAFPLLLVLLAACSSSGNIASDTRDVRSAEGAADVFLRGPETVSDLASLDLSPLDFGHFDQAPELPPLGCQPGEGCFLDKCTENGQCQSGWCVEHMGEGVCSRNCADECPQGWTCKQVGASDPDLVYVCVSDHSNLCKPCNTTQDCKAIGGAEDVCVPYGDTGAFCGGACVEDDDCPWGFSCTDAATVDGIDTRQCLSDAMTCPCTAKSVALKLWTACATANDAGSCTGKRICTEAGLTNCDAPEAAVETCNGIDDDCDGFVDEPLEVQGDYINLCHDDNECTDDNCNGQDGCEHIALDDVECKDGNPCTVADHCVAGSCVGNPVVCDDDNPCTDDSCDGSGGCTFVPNILPCDDGNPCTVGDTCSAAQCTGISIPCDCQKDADCQPFEDGDLCNGTLVCKTDKWPYTCIVDSATVPDCQGPDDGPDALCQTASCDPLTGICSLAPTHEGLACEDGNACTLSDTCQQGACTAGFDRICYDNDPCTDDTCSPDAGCVYTPNDGPCSDGDACTGGDTCVAGECLPGPTINCDDGNLCNGIESCHPETGCAPGLPLDCPSDKNPCNGDEYCHITLGCQQTAPPDCEDGNVCTTDACYPTEGCVSLVNKEPCDDGNVCTLNDKCSEGQCQPGKFVDCNDSNVCTTDWCHPVDGCTHDLNSAPCNDDNVCTTGDFCHLGDCIAAKELNCDDGNVCTTDTCDPNTGCGFTANNGPCDDGNACTVGDSCSKGWCLSGSMLDCNDKDPCSVDSCHETLGCQYADAPDDTLCGDLKNDICKNGNCLCVADCDGMECGDDGCGGDCGQCTGQDACTNGLCVCQPACQGIDCGDDGCGGECGPCPSGSFCDDGTCKVASCGATGVLFQNACIWNVAGGDTYVVPQGVTSVTVTMIGGGGGAGSSFYYPGGGGGSGHYIIKEAFAVTPGESILVQVGAGGGHQADGGPSKFGDLLVDGGNRGLNHSAGSGQPSARGGDGGSGGGAGYTNSANGGGAGSGLSMQGLDASPGQPSANSANPAYRGAGYGAGGGAPSGTSGYNSSCGGLGGANGSDGQTVGGCGGGGGGAGGLKVPGFSLPGTTQNTSGHSGLVWIEF